MFIPTLEWIIKSNIDSKPVNKMSPTSTPNAMSFQSVIEPSSLVSLVFFVFLKDLIEDVDLSCVCVGWVSSILRLEFVNLDALGHHTLFFLVSFWWPHGIPTRRTI